MFSVPDGLTGLISQGWQDPSQSGSSEGVSRTVISSFKRLKEKKFCFHRTLNRCLAEEAKGSATMHIKNYCKY